MTAAASVEDSPLNSGAYVGLEAHDTNSPAPTRATTTAIAVIAFWPPVKPENRERSLSSAALGFRPFTSASA